MAEDIIKEENIEEETEKDVLNEQLEEDNTLDEDIEEVLQGEVEDVVEESETEKFKNENLQLKDKLQRQIAEFDNFRKRTIKEKASMYNDGVVDTIEKLLPVVDNFERALSTETNKDDTFYKGVEMIYKQLIENFTSLGVTPIATVGEAFDANLHFAVQHEENEEFDENTISLEMQKGYIYKEKVIRPAMVKVAN
ncbi:MAG: nucleotide exchange factor GrpE [Lachnospirales bacterium]